MVLPSGPGRAHRLTRERRYAGAASHPAQPGGRTSSTSTKARLLPTRRRGISHQDRREPGVGSSLSVAAPAAPPFGAGRPSPEPADGATESGHPALALATAVRDRPSRQARLRQGRAVVGRHASNAMSIGDRCRQAVQTPEVRVRPRCPCPVRHVDFGCRSGNATETHHSGGLAKALRHAGNISDASAVAPWASPKNLGPNRR